MAKTRGAKSTSSKAGGPKGKDATVKKASVSPIIKKKNDTKKWNTMSHLVLKRFTDNDSILTAGAKRDRAKHPHVAIAELDPSGRAHCKLCGAILNKGSLRFGLMLECHKGYRNLCTLHPDCFWKHPETPKLQKVREINLSPTLTKEQSAAIVEKFGQIQKKMNSVKKEEDDNN